jgi:orotate phosphoribosyltransferase
MMSLTTKLPKETYHVLDDLTVNIEILNNPYGFQLEQLFHMAARINKKRSFLFVSKVLGKHLAVEPQIPLLTGHLLAMRYMEEVHGYKDARANTIAEAIQTKRNMSEMLRSIEQNPIVLPIPITCVGFAETATALGHAVFSTFKGRVKYIHTTREQIEHMTSVINFEEEHSHATSHRVYALEHDFFNEDNEIILIDDEITTGKTSINIIRTMKAVYPTIKTFTILSILDWRSYENRAKFRELEEELGITIHAVSLVEGMIEVKGQPALQEEEIEPIPAVTQHISYFSVSDVMDKNMYLHKSSINANGTKNHSPYLKATGRFGISKEEDDAFAETFQKVGTYLRTFRKGKKTLVIGTGEFMYIPMRVASYMGEGIYYQSTTRSPIYQAEVETYLIQNKFIFDSPENAGITNYLYNIEPNQYDEIFLFVERTSTPNAMNSLIHELRRTQIPFINVVNMTDTTK